MRSVPQGDGIAHAEQLGEGVQFVLDLPEARLVEVDEIHLVHCEDDVRDAEQRHDQRVAARLLDHALACVEQHDGDIGRRGAGDHVARVLHVPRRVGELEAPLGGDEGAVGDVDRDPLFALGPQAVGEQRQVDVAVTAALARLLDMLHLVDENLLRVVEEPADQRRLAVVDRAAGDEAHQVGTGGRAGEDLRRRARSTRHASCPPSPPPTPCRRRASRRAP
jgi:hypothetical protein